VYRGDSKRGIDSRLIHKTGNFSLPTAKNRAGEYKYPAGMLFYTCFSSDFLHPACDVWREEAWNMIRERGDCSFFLSQSA
jgi:hypothetical protein